MRIYFKPDEILQLNPSSQLTEYKYVHFAYRENKNHRTIGMGLRADEWGIVVKWHIRHRSKIAAIIYIIKKAIKRIIKNDK